MPVYHFYKWILSFSVIIATLILPLFLSCVDLDSNPIASDYKGDYDLSVDFRSLPDTLEILKTYPLEWNCTGVDSFYRISISTDPEVRLHRPDDRLPSPLPLYFTESFTGYLTIHGIQPNGTSVDTTSDTIMVVNPYRISIDSAALFSFDTIPFHVTNMRSHSPPDSAISVIWRSGEETDTMASDQHYHYSAATGDTVIITSALIDTSAHHFELPPCTLIVPPKNMPEVAVTESLLVIPAGVAVSFIATASYCDSLHWSVRSLPFDTITTKPAFSFVWTDTLQDTIIVTARNRFGTTGNSDTIIVRVEKNDLELALLAYPTSVQALSFSDWIVEARRNGEKVNYDDAVFLWSVEPENAADSIIISNDTLRILPNELHDRFTVRITAIIGNDTLFPRSATVTVNADRPSIHIVNHHDAAELDDTVHYIVKTSDTNEDGTVDSVFYLADIDSIPRVLSSDTIAVAFSVAGVHTLYFWCKDNEGLSSDTAVTHLTVASPRPWFTTSTLDTSVFIDDSIHLNAEAEAGTSGGSIIAWLWDLDNDNRWDTVTTEGFIDTVFTAPETVVIITACVDDQEDTSETYRTTRLSVLPGEPEVKQITPLETSCFRGDSVAVRIRAFDPNGTVDSFHIILDSDNRFGFSVSPSQSIDTSVSVVLPDSGVWHFTSIAVDNHGFHSPEHRSRDSVSVAGGRPVVHGISPDTCWIFDSVAFTVSASDPNDEITGIRIQWHEDAEWHDATDSTVQHLFTSAGAHVVRLGAVSKRGEFSDTFVDTIHVRKGTPLAAVTAEYDTAWVFDEVEFNVSGTDHNGEIRKWAILWSDNDAPEISSEDGIFTHSFSSTGEHTARAFTIDDDGIPSDTATASIFVRNSSPTVTALRFSVSPDSIFILDSFFLTVKAVDVNGTIDSLFVFRGSDATSPFQKTAATDDSAICTLRFPADESGSHELRLKVTDDDGMTTDTVITLHVRTGRPLVTAVTCSVSPLWVVDDNQYTVTASDTNGNIRKVYVVWDDTDTPDDSIVFNGTRASVDTFFTHSWDTSGGSRTIRFRVLDDDGLHSPWFSKEFEVHKGAPTVYGKNHGDTIQWKAGTGGAFDTMFYVYRGGDVPVMIDTADSNGQVVAIEWDIDDDGTDYSGPELIYSLTISDPKIPVKMKVTAIDDDSIRSEPYIFWIYADEPPPVTTTTHSGPGSPDIRVAWYGLDAKDDSLTQFSITVDATADGAFSNTVISFTEARDNTFGKSGTWLTYTFNPEDFGITSDFFFKVIARDARGSMPSTISPAAVMYPY